MSLLIIVFIVGGLSWIALLLVEHRARSKDTVKKSQVNPVIVPASSTLIRYGEYELCLQEKIVSIVILGVPMAIIGYVFYKSLVIAALISTLGFANMKIRRKQLIERRRNKLNQQFKQALSSLSSSLSSGKSIETAWRDALADLKLIYPDPNCYIIAEFQIIVRKIDNGEAIETAIVNFAERAGLEDIASFADVFMTCKRTGGNLIDVMKRTAGMINEKLEIQQDIAVMVAQKRFEAKVLLFAPIAIVALLSFSSPEYMEPLYSGIGRGIMTASLILLLLCSWFTQKIMNIKV
jgi:tight adherence protein B